MRIESSKEVCRMQYTHMTITDLLSCIGNRDVDMSLVETKDTIHITITDGTISDTDKDEHTSE